MSDEQFSLVWNSFPRNLSSGLYTLLTDEQLVDVTLAAEGQILRAHKLILSVCSTYFRELFKGNSCKHPIVILKDVNYRDLSAMLHFMYQGEVNIKQEDIASFLKVAETLQIKGLTTDSDEKVEDTLGKNVEDLDHLFNVDRDKGNLGSVDENVSTFGSLTHPAEREQTRTRQDNLTETSMGEQTFMEHTSSINNDSCHRQSRTDGDHSLPDMQTAFSEGCGSATDVPSNAEEQPLDCTSDMSQTQETKHEPLDYTVDMDTEQRYEPYMAEKILYNPEENLQRQGSDLPPVLSTPFTLDEATQSVDRVTSSKRCPELKRPSAKRNLLYQQYRRLKDFAPDTQLVPYSQNSQIQPFAGLSNVAGFQSDYMYDTANPTTKGRRTVKGIPGSSLPLETTLRVVSELGPTLRVERGKVIRMYACPWCLRHFTRKENLKLHVRYIHGPLESLTCKLCGNKYKNSNSLRVHSYLYHNAKRDKHGKPLTTGGGNGNAGGNDGGVV